MRVVLVGPPRAGKSTYARELRAKGIPTYCTDPLPLVKDPEADVTYLPDEFAEKGRWSDASKYVADHWLTMPGPWCIDGVATARALRKLVAAGRNSVLNGARIVRFTRQHGHAVTKAGQVSMAKGVDAVWSEVASFFPDAEIRT